MGNPINQTFDATQWSPEQGGSGGHPVGKYAVTIVATENRPTKDGNSGMFVVTFRSDVGQIEMRYNLWNTSSQQAVEIAHKQLSALCHATGVYRVDFSNEGAALRNARCVIEVGEQSQSQADKDAGKKPYVEVKRVYDVNGNEPGKASPGAPQPAAPTGAPMGGPGSPPPGFQPPATPQPAPMQPAPSAAPTPPWQQGATQAAPPWQK